MAMRYRLADIAAAQVWKALGVPVRVAAALQGIPKQVVYWHVARRRSGAIRRRYIRMDDARFELVKALYLDLETPLRVSCTRLEIDRGYVHRIARANGWRRRCELRLDTRLG